MTCEASNSVFVSFAGATILASAVGASFVGSFILGIAVGYYIYKEEKLKEKNKEKEEQNETRT